MGMKWKYAMLGGSLLGAVVLAGCSGNGAQADQAENAASVEWTEQRLAETEGSIAETEERMAELESDIQSLGAGEPTIPEEPIYPDVNSDYFAFEEIQYLSDQGVISGYPSGSFEPGETITRAQTAKMLTAELNLEAPEDYEIQAEDVSPDHHAYDALAALEYHGIMTGSGGEMMAGEGLKRSQMAALLVEAYDLPDAGTQHSFTDIGEDYPNYEEINIIADQQITSEAGDAFRPNETTTRAQFALFMSRTMNDYFIEQ
ncbi:S-layer homology domain-containing protein [Salibacterium qingdaonense]|uniref:S-layer homology domain-containing protein n=1 Tax=Salibacterium qingdaonense TaxID=266892 RepID=A0A1I4L1E3_9BACI|nr:S-layer homology domain-containing protein [Salibacterium qingdaonense]SFL84852.1 S-layer homology domain-containing protein [Salibacterium qingdaonense]